MNRCTCEHPEAYHGAAPVYHGAAERDPGCAFCGCQRFTPSPDPMPVVLLQDPAFTERREQLGLPKMRVR